MFIFQDQVPEGLKGNKNEREPNKVTLITCTFRYTCDSKWFKLTNNIHIPKYAYMYTQVNNVLKYAYKSVHKQHPKMCMQVQLQLNNFLIQILLVKFTSICIMLQYCFMSMKPKKKNPSKTIDCMKWRLYGTHKHFLSYNNF